MPRSWRMGLAVAAALVLALALSPLVYVFALIIADPRASWSAAARADVVGLALRSLLLAASVTVSSLALATLLAWLTARTDLAAGRRWLIALSLPLAAPSFLLAESYRHALRIDGFIGAWLALTLITFPYALLPLDAAFRRVSPDLEFAARSLGLSGWRTFWRASLPQALPTMEWAGLLIALYTLSDYGAVAMLKVRVLTFAIESRRAAFDPAGAAALSGVLSVLALVCLLGAGRLRGSVGAGAVDAQTECLREPVRLGAWRLPGALLCAGTVGVAVGLPVAMALAWWLGGMRVTGQTAAETLTPVLAPAWRTLRVSLIAAALAAALALPIALLIHRAEYVRHARSARASWTRRLGSLALVGYGLPGVVIGFALVRATLSSDPLRVTLYQSLPLLIIGYLIKCVAEALGPTTAAMRRLHTDRLDAAIGLGAPFALTWRRIGWPAIAPGVAAGAALVFLTVVKELPITLILRPTGFDTLATRLFNLLSDVQHTRAAPMALVMLLLSGGAVWWLVGSRRE